MYIKYVLEFHFPQGSEVTHVLLPSLLLASYNTKNILALFQQEIENKYLPWGISLSFRILADRDVPKKLIFFLKENNNNKKL